MCVCGEGEGEREESYGKDWLTLLLLHLIGDS